MNTIIGELGKSPKFCEYIKNLESQKSPIEISGLTDVGMIHMIAGTKEYSKKPICIITYNEIQAKKIEQDLRYFTDKVVFLMCQSGGRVAQCMKVMEKAGYDMSKVYNVGGMAQAEGNNKLEAVKTAEIALEATYNFEGLTQN